MLAKTYVINWKNVVVMKFICSHRQKYKNRIFGNGQCVTKGDAFVHVELNNKPVVPLLGECHSNETMNVVQEENKGDQASRTSVLKEEMKFSPEANMKSYWPKKHYFYLVNKVS